MRCFPLYLTLYLLLPLLGLHYVACNRTIVRTAYEQSAVLNNRFYINGGRVFYNDNETNSQIRSYYPGLRFINQSDANMSTYHLESHKDVPIVAMGALWSDGKDRLYLFGGQYDTDLSSPTYTFPKEKNEVWSYQESINSWSIIESENTPELRPAHGAGLSVPGIQLGFYLGGWADNTTTAGLEQRIPLNSLTIFDMEKRSFRTETIPQSSNPSRVGGRLVYVPVGKSGVLLALGGCTEGSCKEYISLERIDVYDIASGNWFSQNTSSNPDSIAPFKIPEDRYDFCAVRVSSWDRTSHNIYIWSGGRDKYTGVLDDVWVLTLPMFRWIPLYGGQFERKASTCDLAHERFLMYSGGCGAGSNETYCQPVGSQMGTFDLTMGSNSYWDGWQSPLLVTLPWATYAPGLATYLVGEKIRDFIGGSDMDEVKPANITSPVNGWGQEELGDIFSITPAGSTPQEATKDYLRAAGYTSASLLGAAIFLFPLLHYIFRRFYWRLVKSKIWNSTSKPWNHSIHAAIPLVQYTMVNPASKQKRRLPWRPFTLRPAYLVFLTISSVALLVSVELLIRHSLQPEDLPGQRDAYTEDDEPNQVGYFPSIDDRPRIGLYHFWDSVTDNNSKARNQSSRLRTFDYVAWNYLPTVTMVIFGILWGLCDAEVQRIEPYFQLHRDHGALGQDSLSVDYHTFWAPLRIIQAAKKRHWACAVSGTAYIVAFAVLPNLQNFLFSWEKRAGGTYTWMQETFGFRVGLVDPVYGRVIEAMLAVEVVCGVLLLWIYSTRNTGLNGNPIGLAAVAGLVSRGTWPGKGIELGRTSSQIDKDVVGRRFKTVYADGKLRLIEVPAPAVPNTTNTQTWKGWLKSCKIFKNRHLVSVVSHCKRWGGWVSGLAVWGFLPKKRPVMLDAVPLLTFASVLAITFIGSIYILAQMVAVENTSDYTIPLPSNLYLILGVFIKSIYELVEKEVRVGAPYRKLAIERYQRPKVLWEDYTTTMPVVVIISAFQNNQGILALVTIASLALEVWTVLLGSLQVSASDYGSTTYHGDMLSLGLAILCNFIALVSLAVVRSNFRSSYLPCQPATISSVASLVSKAKMLGEDFQDVGFRGGREFRKALEKKHRRYGFAWTGDANEGFLTVDYEPLGDDYRA